jgi:hypothetical protein
VSFSFTESAAREYLEAITYYNLQREGLGYEFAIEVDKALDHIDIYPEAWKLIAPYIRRYLLRRFPYGLVYTIEDDDFIILSVMNLHQKPKSHGI